MSIEVRPATATDVPALLRLYEQLADGFGWRPVDEAEAGRVLGVISHQPGRTLLTAMLDRRIAGTADLLIVGPGITHHGRPWAVLSNVAVDGDLRRRGVGRALMEHAARQARDAGCYKLELTSDRRRTDAHAFYRSVGFRASALAFRRYLD